MNNTPTISLVYDRHHRASNKKEGAIELRITYERKQKYVTTGVRCLPKHWRNGNITNRLDAFEMQNTLDMFVTHARKVLNEQWTNGTFDMATIADEISGRKKVEETRNIASKQFVVDYMRERAMVRMYGRKDDTRERYERFIRWFEEWGKIVTFADVTEQNILLMDEAIKNKNGRAMKEKSRYHNYHRFMKSFLIDAKEDGLIERNPYRRLNITKGEDNIGLNKYITREEFYMIAKANLPMEYLRNARDLFVFQTYTCMAYVDMAAFDADGIRMVGGKPMYFGRRGKTGKEFSFVVLEPAMEILNRHGGKLPMISNQKYNMYLKEVALLAGVDKPLSSHWARHTGATILLNAGVDMEIVSRILGHSSTKMTREVYAKMLDTTIADAMSKVKF